MNTNEELNPLKAEEETVSKEPQALSDEEMEQVSGGKFTVVKQIPAGWPIA